MQYIVTGILASFVEAETAVRDLELAGIVGEQVEVISDIAHDSRTANMPGEPLTKTEEHHRSSIARIFGSSADMERSDVRDIPGRQPNYIGEQEFYANHLRQGGAVMIVRTDNEPTASRAAEILRDHGARTPGRKDGPAIARVD
jgi:hypothetical protein